MAEPFPFSQEEQFVGPEAPGQTLADLATDILVQNGEDQSTEQVLRLYARWDDTEGHTMHLHKFSRDNTEVFRLMVLSLGASEPVANFRYQVNGKGVTLHDIHSKQVAGPNRDNEKAMVKYLQTAEVAPRNGTPNALVNDVFWQIAGCYALTEPAVAGLIVDIAEKQTDSERFSLIERAAAKIRELPLGLPEDLVQSVLEDFTREL